MSGKPDSKPDREPMPFPLSVVIIGKPMADGRAVADALSRVTGEPFEMWWARQLRPGAAGLVVCPKVAPSQIHPALGLASVPIWTSLPTSDDGRGLWPFLNKFPRFPQRRDDDDPSTFRAKSILRGVAFALAVTVLWTWLAGCAPLQEPAAAPASSIPAPKKTPAEPPESPAERVFERTAQQAAGMGGSAAARSARVTGNVYIDTLASSAVRNTVSELQRWWKNQ